MSDTIGNIQRLLRSSHKPTTSSREAANNCQRIRLVDLFAGVGGLSLGAHEEGFEVSAAFDSDPILSSSYKYNFPNTQLHLKDLSSTDGATIAAAVGGRVDGLIGGPPCQGFSSIGKRINTDPRSQLLAHFFRIVAEVLPTFFVMENVTGLGYADARGVLDRALLPVIDQYAILGPTVLNAADFGAATIRRRLFVIGIHKDQGEGATIEAFASLQRSPATVRAAIADMEGALAVGERDGFDEWQILRRGRPHDYARPLRSDDRLFTGHRFTSHSKTVADRFAKVPQGDVDVVGRHPRLAWSGQCPTLRAGTGPDRGSFQSVRPIHPEEPRVITVREAARLQGFPDNHRFHPTIWHSFRMIGNSVCPIVARAIFRVIKTKIALSASAE